MINDTSVKDSQITHLFIYPIFILPMRKLCKSWFFSYFVTKESGICLFRVGIRLERSVESFSCLTARIYMRKVHMSNDQIFKQSPSLITAEVFSLFFCPFNTIMLWIFRALISSYCSTSFIYQVQVMSCKYRRR